jgi:Protein of unknown function (DUF4232)
MFSSRWFIGFAAVVAACAVAACGSSSTTSDQTGGGATQTVTLPGTTVTQTVTGTLTTGTTTTGTTTTGTTATGTTGTTTTGNGNGSGECVAADLTPSFLGTNGAAGTIAVGFALTNSSGSTCTTYGWPGVLLLSSTGAALPTDAMRTSSDLLGSTPAADITLKPGQQASFRLIASDFASGSTTTCENATDLQIIAPNDTATLKVAISGGIPACGHATLSPLMTGTSAWPTQ